MTQSKTSLFERNCRKALSNLSKLPTWKKVAFGFMFFLLFLFTCGGSGLVTLAVLVGLPDGMIMSGKSGTIVYQKNGRRRVWASPANPQTTGQTNVRNFFGSFASLWRSLTGPQQTGWRNLSFTRQNRVGKDYTYKGMQAYIRLNQFLSLIGVAQIDTAPTLEGCIAPEQSASTTIDISDAKIDLNLSNADASLGIMVFASLPLGPGQTTKRTALINGRSDSTSLLLDSQNWTGYLLHWGYTPVAGDRILVECHYVNNTTGEPSPYALKQIVTVTA